MRRKLANWSLICFPLALVCVIGAFTFIPAGHTWSAVGVSLLGLYMFLVQAAWAHFALATTRPSVSDIVFMVFFLSGVAFTIALIWCGLGTISEVAGNRLALAAMGLPLLGYPAANAASRFFPRPKTEAEGTADQAA